MFIYIEKQGKGCDDFEALWRRNKSAFHRNEKPSYQYDKRI